MHWNITRLNMFYVMGCTCLIFSILFIFNISHSENCQLVLKYDNELGNFHVYV